SALRHKSAGVRRNAVLVLPRTNDAAKAILDRDLLADPDAQVRLAALLALSNMPASAKAGQAIADLMNRRENADDRWIPDAATNAAAAHDLHFLKAMSAAKTPALPKLRDVAKV